MGTRAPGRQMDSTNLSFLCPITKRGIDSGFDADNASRFGAAEEKVEIACPHCGTSHEFYMFNAFGQINDNPEDDNKGFELK
jgi:hypothetical protein